MNPYDSLARIPLDYPYPDRPHRIHVALTNHCNRSCPWCCTCSSPSGNTWLDFETFTTLLPKEGLFQIQLEGGEPTLHPRFWDFVKIAQSHSRCDRLILCTNGVVLPRKRDALRAWLKRMGEPCTIKLSINHHLLDHDKGLIPLAQELRDGCAESEGDQSLVLSVRRRRGYEQDDQRVVDAVTEAGLMEHANIFYLKRYGFASEEAEWDDPVPSVPVDFTMITPDGQTFGPDLVARSEAMRSLD